MFLRMLSACHLRPFQSECHDVCWRSIVLGTGAIWGIFTQVDAFRFSMRLGGRETGATTANQHVNHCGTTWSWQLGCSCSRSACLWDATTEQRVATSVLVFPMQSIMVKQRLVLDLDRSWIDRWCRLKVQRWGTTVKPKLRQASKTSFYGDYRILPQRSSYN